MGACRGPDDRLYMITEFLPGGDLSHLIARKPLPPWEERLKVVIDVARYGDTFVDPDMTG